MLINSIEDTAALKGETLLLLTKHFPFNDGNTPAESYLETEIGLIARYFDFVVIVATEAGASSLQKQETPENVRAFALGRVQTRAEKAACLANGIFSLRSMPDAAKVIESDFALTISQAMFRLYYIGKALRKWAALNELLVRERVKPTHVYSFWFHDTALVACWLKRKYLRARAVARAHGYDLYHDRTRCGLLPCRKYQLGSLDAVIPCSEDGSSYLKELYPAFSGKIQTGYLGTRWLPDMSGEARGRVFKVVSCSAVTDVKRVTMLAEALGMLDLQGVEIEWTHFGDGPKLPAVKEMAERFGTVCCRFAGNVANATILEEYGRGHYDLFVNVSESEGLPISIMEASGHGIPVLATDVGGTHEIVSDGMNGKLIPEDCDAKGVADAVLSFIHMSDGDYALMRGAARERWVDRFQTKNNVATLIDELLPTEDSKGGVA